MIVFNKSLLENTFLRKEAQSLANSGFISNNELKQKFSKINVLKSEDNVLLRLALFILGALAYASICGALSIFTYKSLDSDSHWITAVLTYAIIGIVAQELFFVKNSNYYGNGIDDAFILGAIGLIGSVVFMSTDSIYHEPNESITAVSVCIVSTLAFLRYLHLPSIIIACLSFTATVFYSVYSYLEIGQQILPFVLFFTGLLLYYFSKKTIHSLKEPYYENGLLIVKYFGLLLAYFAMNYLLVREMSAKLQDKYYYESPEIPMAWLFYIFTITTLST